MLQNYRAIAERFRACRQDINEHILMRDIPMRVGSK